MRIRYRVKFALHDHFMKHGLFARDFAHRRLFICRQMRGAHVHGELHNYNRVRYVDFGIADPFAHRWWATSVTFYFTLGRSRQAVSDRIFRHMPSTGYRSHDFIWLMPREQRANARRMRAWKSERDKRKAAAR